MGTTADKIALLKNTKTEIKTAIENKGVEVGNIPFGEYAEKINSITTGGGGEEIQGIVCNALSKSETTEIKIIPQSFTANMTSFTGAFLNHAKLTTLPKKILTSNGTNFNSMFDGCGSIKTIPQFDTSKGTNFSYIFRSCTNLTTIPLLNTSNGTNFRSMFEQCSKLTTIPLLNTSNGTNFTYMFYYCSKLTTIPQLDTSKGTDFTYMFYRCGELTTIPQLDVSNALALNYMFDYCYWLKDFGGLLNAKQSFSLGNCGNLTHQSLLNVLNGLADLTAGTSRKLTLGSKNLAKLTDQEKAIATNKNWTLA